MSLNGLKLCKLVSRSNLFLVSFWNADHSLDFVGTYLVLQACISCFSASDKNGAFLLLPCSHRNAVAQCHDGCFLLREGTQWIGVSEKASAIVVRIDDVWSILKFRIGFAFGENSAGFCKFVWLSGSILNFRSGSVSSIGGLFAATLLADTVSDSQNGGTDCQGEATSVAGVLRGNTIRGNTTRNSEGKMAL